MKLWQIPSSYAASTLPREWNFHANFMFVISNLFTSPDSCKIFTCVNPELPQPWYDNFILGYPPYYILKGNFSTDILQRILPLDSELRLVFEPQMLSKIDKLFPERTTTDPSGKSKENHFLCMTLLPHGLLHPSRPLKEVKAYFLTSHAEYCHHGWNPAYLILPIGAGLVVVGKIGEGIPRSIAPAPNLVIKEGFSFAIIRGVQTYLPFRNRGYAQHAVAKLAKFLFKEYNLSAIHLWVEEENQPAIAVYKKIGFKTTGTLLASACNMSSGIQEEKG